MPEYIGHFLKSVNDTWGVYGLLILACAVLGGMAWSQNRSLRRRESIASSTFSSMAEVVSILKDVAEGQQKQHVFCAEHTSMAQVTINEIAGIAREFSIMRQSFYDSRMAEAREVTQIVSQLATARQLDIDAVADRIAAKLIAHAEAQKGTA